MKIAVVGTGYVGLSIATLISRKYPVVAVDVVEEKVNKINNRVSPIVDKDIQKYLSSGKLDLIATSNICDCIGSDFVIIATPTNYDSISNSFNTSSVETVLAQINVLSPDSIIVIKSTIPIGFTESISKKYGYNNIIFSPEFLREGRALYDNLHPSRIIAGIPNELLRSKAEQFVSLLSECSEDDNVKCIVMGSTEAESVKLFSNTYLAMRVAFFNELDTFAQQKNLNAKEIISGMCMDPRIGDYYNNPSFGYGGYCLPKDTKQLLSNFNEVPSSLIYAIVKSNIIRKKYIADTIDNKLGKIKSTIGVYRLIMKSGSDNFRESSIVDIMKDLCTRGHEIVIYEPTIEGDYLGWSVNNNIQSFCENVDVILANRITEELVSYRDKVYCRDIFNRD